MQNNYPSITPPENRSPVADPEKFDEFLDAWETARTAYQQVLRKGVDRSDLDLSRDASYAMLLRAGQMIHMLGGTGAVWSVARRLGNGVRHGSPDHFGRLWQGLLPRRLN